MSAPIVLVNAGAGTAAQLTDGPLDRRIAEGFAQAGSRAEVRMIEPARLDEALREVRRAERPLIVAGGDGSVSAAVQVFAGSGIPLGVLPLGTYNLLGHDLGVSTDLDEAVRQLATAGEARIDLGRIGRRYFHTLVGLGFFSRVARERAQVRQSMPQSKIIGAAVAAVRSFTRGGNLDVTIEAGGRTEACRTPALLVTNNSLGATTWRRSRLDGGYLEANMLRGDGPFPLLRGGVQAFLGSWRESEDIVTLRGSELVLSFTRPRVFASIDGESTRPRTPLHLSSAPGALTCLVPKEPAGGSGADEPEAALAG